MMSERHSDPAHDTEIHKLKIVLFPSPCKDRKEDPLNGLVVEDRIAVIGPGRHMVEGSILEHAWLSHTP
jgi:hypothetical protein